MKLGIITFHQALNYGAVLQAYALREYISRNFDQVQAEVLDYRCPALSEFYSIAGQKSGSAVKTFIKTGHFLVKRGCFRQFSRKHIPLSRTAYTPGTIANANRDYDLFLTGSDQVWNPDLTRQDENYLLAFSPPEKRYSYAASIGRSEFPEALRVEYRELLNSFAGISLREESAVRTLVELGVEQPVLVHPDPVLLLTQQDWSRLCASGGAGQKDYVLVFAVARSEALIRQAVEFARAKGLPVLYVGQHTGNRDVTYIPFLRIEKLLALFRDARYVFTNSFHGTAFSIIFHRKFHSSVQYADGRNSRIMDMLEKTGLSDRLLAENMEKEIPWEQVDSLVTAGRRKAHDYLKWILTDENRTH